MPKRRAFTLMEVLMVVAILALLLATLYPAFAGARRAVKRTVCMHNMKDIVLAMMDYAAANGNRLPADYYGAPPFGALDSSDTRKCLNPYLKGESYRVLECPADRGENPDDEASLFDTRGYSYVYMTSTTQGISKVVGEVSYQEEKMGYASGFTETDVRRGLGYYGAGPEEQPDPNGTDPTRSRDITRDEIDNEAVPAIRRAQAAMAGQDGFNVNSDQFKWRYKVGSYNPNPYPPPDPPSPNVKWGDQFAGGGMPVPRSSSNYNSGRWHHANPWTRSVYHLDYWTRASRKVCLLDGDYSLTGWTGSGSNKRPNRGFWHDYAWQLKPDPDSNRNMHPDYASVWVHAGFLDGHVDRIELNRYGSVDREHDYY